MNDDRSRILQLVEEALDSGSSPEAVCANYPEVIAEVGRILEQCQHNEVALQELFPGRFSSPLSTSAASLEGPGTVVGTYKLLQQIGEGAFGTVYMAEQTQPVKRRVAVKVIKAGMDTREVIARFEAERQALAMMDHPNIARVFDAGATDSGRPYFVMELVNGVPLTTYCDINLLTTRRRLELMIPVCRAVHSAHQKGIIHRDLKPSNVLVTMHDGVPVPKVIDFGIAKATATSLTDRTLFTAFGGLIGTPAYMSPEQAERSGLGIDTRTDVYGLGAMLYEVLTGTTPMDPQVLKAASHEELSRMIREAEPSKPSTKLTTLGGAINAIASARGSEPRRLGRLMRGELDWIVMKALEKDRTRRYDTAAALADDVARYLGGEPVSAGPPGRAYLLRKFARRHHAAIGIAAVVLTTLLLGVAGTTVGLVREARERRLAEARRADADEQRRIAQAVVRFLTRDVLAKVSPRSTTDPDIRGTLVKALIEPALQTVGQRFNDEPLVRAAVRTTLAQTLVELDRFDLAMPQAKLAWQERQTQLGDDHPDTIEALSVYVNTLAGSGGSLGAEPVLRLGWDGAQRPASKDERKIARAPNNYAPTPEMLRRYAESETLAYQAWDRSRRVLGDNRIETVHAKVTYAWILDHLGRFAAAEPLARQAWKESRHEWGDDYIETVRAENTYALILDRLGRYAAAEPLVRLGWQRNQRMLGANHPDTIWMENTCALVLMDQDRVAEAESLMQEAWAHARQMRGGGDPLTADVLTNYVNILKRQGQWVRAEPLLRQASEGKRQPPGSQHSDMLTALTDYAGVLARKGDWTGAVQEFSDAVADARRADQAGAASFAILLFAEGNFLRQFKHPAEAIAPLREATNLLRTIAPDDPDRGRDLYGLGTCLMASGKPEDAEAVFRENYVFVLGHSPLGDTSPPASLRGILASLRAQGKPADLQAIESEYRPTAQNRPAPTTTSTIAPSDGGHVRQ